MASSRTITQLIQELDQAQARTDEKLREWVADYKVKSAQVGETRAAVDFTLLFAAMHQDGIAALLAAAIKQLAQKEK
jgi:hypothetical protein